MKIEVQDKPFGIPFSQVKAGEVFKWDDCYYMRLDLEESLENNPNVVSLTTNVLCWFANSEMVEPVNAKLVISE